MTRTPFDRAMRAYLDTLERGEKAYAAHYAHHVSGGTPTEIGFACTKAERASLRRDIDAAWERLRFPCLNCNHARANAEQASACCTMQGIECEQCAEELDCAIAEDRAEGY